MNLYPVSISLSSFGADRVRLLGQASFVPLLASAGASRIELREELFTDANHEELARAIAAHGLECLYSAPLELWDKGRNRPGADLEPTLLRAQACGARWLKVSLGYFTDDCDLQALATCLARHPVRLLVENDQTDHGGRIEPFARFLAKAEQLQVPLGMTFDIGNWQWQAQSALAAAEQLGRHVEYVHCKGVGRNNHGKFIARLPDADDLQLWEHMFSQMPPGIARAVEYPLQGDDLLQLTREQIGGLARLGQPREAHAHV